MVDKLNRATATHKDSFAFRNDLDNREEKERLWQATCKERAEHIENLEMVLTGLKITSAVGLGTAVALGAWQLGLVAAIGRGGLALLSRAAPVAVAGSKFGRQALRHPFQTIRSLSEPLGRSGQWVKDKWYRRWAPVPLLMGAGLTRTYWVDRDLAKERKKLQVEPPSSLVETIKQTSPSWSEEIKIVQQYSHRQDLIQTVLPKMYAQVVTPEGALVLTHTLLETFSLSPVLDPAAKHAWDHFIEEQFERALHHYGQWVLTLNLTGAAASPERVYEIQTEDQTSYIRGYVVQPGIKDLIEEMRKEKEALLELMALHEVWTDHRLREEVPEQHEAYMKVIRFRRKYVQKVYAIHWNEVQSRLNNLDQYLAKIQESFASMGIDFQMKNRDIWIHYAEHASLANLITNPSPGQFLGWWGGTLFVQGSGFVSFLKAIPFGLAAGFVTSSYTAEALARQDLPIEMCLPSYGALCEQL